MFLADPAEDPTRVPAEFDATAEALVAAGCVHVVNRESSRGGWQRLTERRKKMDPELRHRISGEHQENRHAAGASFTPCALGCGCSGVALPRSTVPGTPEVSSSRDWRLAVHVDGVWWHGHPDYFIPGKRGPYAEIGEDCRKPC